MTSVFVGIDPSLTNTGVCVLDNTGKILRLAESKSVVKAKHKYSNPFFRLIAISEFVVSCLDPYTDIYICYEDYSYQSINKPFTLGELGGVLKTNIITRCNAIAFIPPKVLKKFAVGHGSADKEMLLEQFKLEQGVGSVSTDICDAYFLAKMAQFIFTEIPSAEYFGEFYLRARLEVVKKKDKYTVFTL